MPRPARPSSALGPGFVRPIGRTFRLLSPSLRLGAESLEFQAAARRSRVPPACWTWPEVEYISYGVPTYIPDLHCALKLCPETVPCIGRDALSWSSANMVLTTKNLRFQKLKFEMEFGLRFAFALSQWRLRPAVPHTPRGAKAPMYNHLAGATPLAQFRPILEEPRQ